MHSCTQAMKLAAAEPVRSASVCPCPHTVSKSTCVSSLYASAATSAESAGRSSSIRELRIAQEMLQGCLDNILHIIVVGAALPDPFRALGHHRADGGQVGRVQIAVAGCAKQGALRAAAAHAQGEDAVHIAGQQIPVVADIADRRLEVRHAGLRYPMPWDHCIRQP